ncbi:M23 family metallopeptidase [Oceanihabitans sp. 2_MG-2023]|uniref:M23 family metallopeptidase n=1 Tax=Oceanihabitans sp. 2_MG-2023 TaxID=3062661 RepID=UPI0026E1837B|nr:M23 family metallopeptidase [Oceanihabitans sp. 2_MG-2023]MDO6597519.1 M23 family metallopeptidase [Oceanihabitans sp. 2_MG-2023]
MKILFILMLFYTSLCNAQSIYPTDYFRSPLDITLIAAGTFGELRSNHFHSGMDLKTQQRQGLHVYGAADGYISRIKVSHFGYGKALYVTHPNGYTTVYGHLQSFSKEIEAYVKKRQYEEESFEIQLFPNPEELKINKGEIIAYSGNTGSSGGPHLHYEIRDNQERPINPLLFGLDIKDSTKPIITEVYAYAIGENAHINKSKKKQKLRLIDNKNGTYSVENIEAYGKIGFAIATIDRQDLAANKNGVYNIQARYNGDLCFELDFKRFSFNETKHLNRLIDYDLYKTKKQRLQKLFIEENNPLSMYNNSSNDGYVEVEDNTSSVYKVRVKDIEDNDAWLQINIKGVKSNDIEPLEDTTTPFYIYANQDENLNEGRVHVNISKNTFYDDFFIDFKVEKDTLTLHKNTIPAKKNFDISYDLSGYTTEDASKLYIARLVGWNDYPLYSTTKRKGNILTTSTKTLGKYALATDTIAPTIKPKNFSKGKWLSKYRFLKIKIEDQGSGISNYRATINGKWILTEYDYKTKTLTYDFNDGVSTETKNNLKLIVTDNVGNNSTFETMFYRK